MRVKHSAGIFGMELGADEPAVVGDFDDFDQVALWVGTDTLHAVLLVFFFVFVVEFVSVVLERNGDFCNTVFITAYDKEYVNEVIGKYLQHSRYQDYTDKYFDFEYSLPVNSYSVLSSYAGQYLCDNIVLNQGDRINIAQLKDAWNVNGGFIVAKLGTMRHVKRYLNILMSRYPKVKNDVDVSDFMILTLLRYTDLAAYNAVFEFQFLRRGSLYADGTPKLIYLQND